MTTLQGGESLKQKLRELSAKVTKSASVKVGFLAGATYPNGTPVAAVAAIQNFGAPAAGIPPRPFFSNMVADKNEGWGDSLGNALLVSDFDGTKAMTVMGEEIAGQLREAIVNTTEPPLSPVTLMLRKMFGNNPQEIRGRDVGEAARRVAAGEDYGGVSTKPLEWTGFMLSRVEYEVQS